MQRRDFLKASAATAVATTLARNAAAENAGFTVVDEFDRRDSLGHGDLWETLNPGYWSISGGALRRRLRNVGDRARKTGFPFHYETHQSQPMPVEYDPSLPFGMIWRRDWDLTGNYSIRAELTVMAAAPGPAEESESGWKQHQRGYGVMGLCFGGHSLHEGWTGRGEPGQAAWMVAWRDDDEFGFYDHATDEPRPVSWKEGLPLDAVRPTTPVPGVGPGSHVVIDLTVSGGSDRAADVSASLRIDGGLAGELRLSRVDRRLFTDGRFGIVARGLVDFEVDRVSLDAGDNTPLAVHTNELHVAYALGDTLREVDGRWRCTFVALFRNDGETAEIRVSDRAAPAGGWDDVPVAGVAAIVSNAFRRSSASVEVTLPASPAETTLYYTVWKDGRNVTSDPRSGYLGRKDYVGRLPQLMAPYRLCGLSCHAISVTSDLPDGGLFQADWIHGQPTRDAFKYLEDFGFQVMLWEDDVWYLELVIYPPSTDDAYKIITETLAGTTTRWQMMRHWNVINPGDHDHGMDDVKGPEQIVIRTRDGLGQDAEYMRRNFQIVSHLISGDERPSGTDNPKRWRRWKMPNRDFSLLIVDSRLWRSSQDTHIWDDQGWGHEPNLYDRADPTRSLLGEEQFAWLQEMIRTDSSPLICLTGINGLHTIWDGRYYGEDVRPGFEQRDRVAADYAGWVKAGVDRVLELLGSRDGIVSVYGDVHNGCIMKNRDHRVYECSFGPIGRYGGRRPKEGFGHGMLDHDGRPIDVVALYHRDYQTPELEPIQGPTYWNHLEMCFDPRGTSPMIELAIRNLVDSPDDPVRGGGSVRVAASTTGRDFGTLLPSIRTLPGADVQFTLTDGTPLRAARSTPEGIVPVAGLVEAPAGARVLMVARTDDRAEARLIETTGA